MALPVSLAFGLPPGLSLLVGGVVAHLLLAVTLVLAAAVAGLMAYHYAQARLRERRGFSFDPETSEVTEETDGAAAVRARSAEEIANIRARIETLMEEQQVRTETQGQHLAQKLDDIRSQMGGQDRKIDGLRSELRHEITRRDGELDELRGQLASALDAFWKAMPALPAGPGGDALALPAHVEPAHEPAHAEPGDPAGDGSGVPAPAPPTPSAPAFASLTDFTPSYAAQAVTPPAAAPAVEEVFAVSSTPLPAGPSWADAATWAAVTAPSPAPPPEAPAPPAPGEPAAPAYAAPAFTPLGAAPADSPVAAPPAPPPFATADTFAPAPAAPPTPAAQPPPAAPPAPAAPPVPEDADDLTVIRGIDAEMQQKLYAAGVHHLDEIARWSRADARRISGAIAVPEETVMHQWVFEAQSVLFEHYQQQMVRQQGRAVPA